MDSSFFVIENSTVRIWNVIVIMYHLSLHDNKSREITSNLNLFYKNDDILRLTTDAIYKLDSKRNIQLSLKVFVQDILK